MTHEQFLHKAINELTRQLNELEANKRDAINSEDWSAAYFANQVIARVGYEHITMICAWEDLHEGA